MCATASEPSSSSWRARRRWILPLVVRGSMPLRTSAMPVLASANSDASARRMSATSDVRVGARQRARLDLDDHRDLGRLTGQLERRGEASGIRRDDGRGDRLDVLREDVAAVRDDEVLEAPGDDDLAVDDRSQVAGAQDTRPAHPARRCPNDSAVSSGRPQ